MKPHVMKIASRHGNETLRRIGVAIMVAGFIAILLPAPPADPLASAREIYELVARHYWWQFGGCAGAILGNLVRLIGKQGHPGLPSPRLYNGMPAELAARIQLRRRAWENRAKALRG